MSRYRWLAFAAALVLTNCVHSSTLPSTSPSPNVFVPSLQIQSGTLRSRWNLFRTPTTPLLPSFFVQDKYYNVWWIDSIPSLDKIDTSGKITVFPLPADAGGSLAYGNDGNLWVGGGAKIYRVSPDGVILRTYATNGNLQYLTPGFGNDMWFTDGTYQRFAVKHLSYGGSITTYREPSAFSYYVPLGISRGPNGNIWFLAKRVDDDTAIGRLNPTTGTVTEKDMTVGRSGSSFLVMGPDKRLWFTLFIPAALRAVNTNFAEALYPLPSGEGSPTDQIAVGQDGALYAGAESSAGSGTLLRAATSGHITTYTFPSGLPCCPFSIAAGPPGFVWFSTPNGIGRFALP